LRPLSGLTMLDKQRNTNIRETLQVPNMVEICFSIKIKRENMWQEKKMIDSHHWPCGFIGADAVFWDDQNKDGTCSSIFKSRGMIVIGNQSCL
jgi:hypothetical protein